MSTSSRTGVYERIRADILRCALRPGTRINEQTLARRFSVSKSPVRDALLRLQEQHLVQVLPRKGYRVLPISVTDATELYAMRLLYERACVSGAIENASDDELLALDAYRKPPARRALAAWIAYNREFHIAVARICGNSRLTRAAISVIEQFDRLTYLGLAQAPDPASLQDFVREHTAIIDAMQGRNRRLAQALMRKHVENSSSRTHDAIANPVIVP